MFTRENLIQLCERGIVNHVDWSNRDSSSAQMQLGKCWALLKAGCSFDIRTSGSCATDEHTIWLDIRFPGFGYFESSESYEEELFYIPTELRLTNSNGGDWY